MNSYERTLLEYLLKKTPLHKNKDREFTHNFINNFTDTIDNCEVCKELIFRIKYLNVKDDYKDDIKQLRMRTKHKCIICDNIFTGKNRNNIKEFINILKEHHKYYDFSKIKTQKNSYFEFYICIFSFINDLIKFLIKTNNELVIKLKENIITRENFVIKLINCEFINSIIKYLLDNKKKTCINCNCDICNIQIKKSDVEQFTKIIYDNFHRNTTKIETLNDYIIIKLIYTNYDLYLKDYFVKNKYLLFSLFRKDKNINKTFQWDIYFKEQKFYEYIQNNEIFKKLTGLIRYFIISFKNDLSYSYNDLVMMNNHDWKKYMIKLIYHIKQIKECQLF